MQIHRLCLEQTLLHEPLCIKILKELAQEYRKSVLNATSKARPSTSDTTCNLTAPTMQHWSLSEITINEQGVGATTSWHTPVSASTKSSSRGMPYKVPHKLNGFCAVDILHAFGTRKGGRYSQSSTTTAAQGDITGPSTLKFC